MKQKINLALIADSRYAIPAAVTLRSAIYHNPGNIGKLFLLSTDYRQEDLSILESICNEADIAFNPINVDDALLDSYDGLSGWSKYTFIKTLIPKLLPDEDRLLYLDVDMLITGDLSEVYTKDMEGKAVSAVLDFPVVKEDNARCGLPEDNPYINTGFMVMDLKQWREADKEGLFEKAIERLQGMNPPFINDQDVINTVFQGNCQALPERYNVTNLSFGIHSLYCRKGFRDAWFSGRKDPAVIHFTGARRPWKPDVFHPYKKEWFKVLGQTPYKDSIPYCRLSKNSLKSWCSTMLGALLDKFRLTLL